MPLPQRFRHILVAGLCLVGFAVFHSAVVLAAPVACKPGEVARGERISETCSCRGWTITAECRSQCCSRLNMVAGIHAMCGDICDRKPTTVASSDLVRETDDGGALLLAERQPRRYPRFRFGVSAFTLPDASKLVSDGFPEYTVVLEVLQIAAVGEPEFEASGLGVGVTVDLAPRWSVEVGWLRSDDTTAAADVLEGFFEGRLRRTVGLEAVRLLARFGHNDPSVSCPWSFGLGVQRWRVEQSRPTAEDLAGPFFDAIAPLLGLSTTYDGPIFGVERGRLVELTDQNEDIDEIIASIGWNKRWNRLAAHVEATYGSESSLAASVGISVAIRP